ncbi:MAG: glycosyltransferase [Deltaproteobacteria bacterium]|nr:glycosyltransferase [Deltaproteobacteria bacterium]
MGFTVAGVLLWAVYARREAKKLRSDPRLDLAPALPLPEPRPVVSILIPARNEAATLGPCLRSLLAQTVPAREILVVDDQSTDGTGAVAGAMAARHPQIRCLRVEELPEGWGGKNHALALGAAKASGEWLLFTDADTQHAPEALAQTLAYSCHQGLALCSLTGRQRCESFWEHAVQPVVYAFLDFRFSLKRIRDPACPDAAANGQYLLVRREAYERAGGHAALRGDLLEDVALARRAKALGYRIGLVRAPELVATRMYTSLGGLWEGWTRNLLLLAGGRVGAAVEIAAWLLGLSVVPFVAGGTLLIGVGTGAAPPAAGVIAGLACAAILAQEAGLRRLRGYAPGWAVLQPLGALAVLAILVRSTWRGLLGLGVTWKGRAYSARA